MTNFIFTFLIVFIIGLNLTAIVFLGNELIKEFKKIHAERKQRKLIKLMLVINFLLDKREEEKQEKE